MPTSTSSYARILVQYPYMVIAVVFVVVATCLVVSITVGEAPNFDDPTAGFEARGTEISNRIIAYENLVKNMGELSLTPYPSQQNRNILDIARRQPGKTKKLKKKKGYEKPRSNTSVTYKDEIDGGRKLDYGSNNVEDEDEENDTNSENENWRKEKSRARLCSTLPDVRYARVVFATVDGTSLFTVRNIKAMCRFEKRYIRSYEDFRNICDKSNKKCCLSWSIGNILAAFVNKSHCRQINDADMGYVTNLLRSCADAYHSGLLDPECQTVACTNSSRVSSKCHYHRVAVHLLLHYIADVDFALHLTEQPPKVSPLRYAITFLPVAGGVATTGLYKFIKKWQSLKFGNIKIVAMKFGIKYILFDEYLISDTVWLSAAGICVFFVLWLYSTSIFITVMTFLAMFWSLEMAYFIYMFVFEIGFFPYMNMAFVIVMIAIGADDVLIFCKAWYLSKSERNNGTLEKIVTDTLKHATLSMLVTSMTTAAAFYSNYVSKITAIRCFSIYAGTAIVINYVLMVTWIPAAIVIYEKWCDCCVCCSTEFYSSRSNLCRCLYKFPYKLYYMICDWCRIFFEKLLPCIIIKLRYLWFVLCSALGICGVIVIFYYPGLKLPSSQHFEVFSADHVLEVYNLKISQYFAFENSYMEELHRLPVTIIWGVKAVDNGNHLDPQSKGSLTLDEMFLPTTADAQIWLLDFCKRLRQTDFYQLVSGLQLTNCFLENFKVYMSQPCATNAVKPHTPCCSDSIFPYSEAIMARCVAEYIPKLLKSRFAHYTHNTPGPRFKDGRISALIVDFPSNAQFSTVYQNMSEFYQKVNMWVSKEMARAPAEMGHGWFVSDLSFYDLQQSLISGTPQAIGVSLAVVAVITFLTTLNLLITLHAIITIACIIFVTLACLVLLGWELNILESVVTTVAIGMSIDYTLHYGVMYRLAPDLDREMRVAYSVSRMGSAIATAALTTFIGGSLMLPCTVLAYQQFGTFLMLITLVSWVYATFYFQTLLSMFGPQGGFGQFHWPALYCCSASLRHHVDKTVYALSESTLSSSSTSYPTHATSESHELEPLTETSDSRTSSSYNYRYPHNRQYRDRHKQQPPHQSGRSASQCSIEYTRTSTTSNSPVLLPKRETHVTFQASTFHSDSANGDSPIPISEAGSDKHEKRLDKDVDACDSCQGLLSSSQNAF